jgi:hypothetical protein
MQQPDRFGRAGDRRPAKSSVAANLSKNLIEGQNVIGGLPVVYQCLVDCGAVRVA